MVDFVEFVWIVDFCLPIRGTASDVVGIIAETRFMKTVSDRRTVTSARGIKIKTKRLWGILIYKSRVSPFFSGRWISGIMAN